MPNLPAPVAKPRVIVELNDDGTWTIEHYLNGARSRITCARGLESVEIREALIEQRQDLLRRAQAKALAQAKADASRHSRVYNTARYDHGTYFADRFIGKPKRGNIHDPDDTPAPARKAKVKPTPTPAALISLADMMDLL